MATIFKRKDKVGKYHVKIRRTGFSTKTKDFRSLKDARWLARFSSRIKKTADGKWSDRENGWYVLIGSESTGTRTTNRKKAKSVAVE